jgi:hypothetical protein
MKSHCAAQPERSLERFLAGVLLLACLASPLPAAAAWYQVEVIVFERLKPDPDGELFVDNPGLPDRSAGIELLAEPPPGAETAAPGSSVLVPFLKLPADRYRLEGIYRVLRLSSEYRPLLHVAWQQPGEGPNASRSVFLEAFADEGARSAQAEGFAPMQPLLNGLVGIRVSRFLHADVDMVYFPPESRLRAGTTADGDGRGASQADYVRLRERRKILLNELHYFDHPLFGIILQVSRIQQEERPIE